MLISSVSEGKVFKLLTKQGGKQKVKDIVVPDGTNLAVTKKKGDDPDEAAEKDALKRQVLAYDVARQEEERKMERAQRFGRGPMDAAQRLEAGSRFNASREVQGPRKNEKHKGEAEFQDIAEKAKKHGGTSKGGWKGADALGIDFEM